MLRVSYHVTSTRKDLLESGSGIPLREVTEYDAEPGIDDSKRARMEAG